MPIEKGNPPGETENILTDVIYDTLDAVIQIVMVVVRLLIETIEMLLSEVTRKGD